MRYARDGAGADRAITEVICYWKGRCHRRDERGSKRRSVLILLTDASGHGEKGKEERGRIEDIFGGGRGANGGRKRGRNGGEREAANA